MPLSALLSPTADDCPPRWVVYCVEPAVDAVVLLEIAAAADLLAEPFLDRGVRCVAGAKAAVVGTETLAAWVEATYGGADNGDSGSGGDGGGGINPMVKGLTWVWNTGRCVRPSRVVDGDLSKHHIEPTTTRLIHHHTRPYIPTHLQVRLDPPAPRAAGRRRVLPLGALLARAAGAPAGGGSSWRRG